MSSNLGKIIKKVGQFGLRWYKKFLTPSFFSWTPQKHCQCHCVHLKICWNCAHRQKQAYAAWGTRCTRWRRAMAFAAKCLWRRRNIWTVSNLRWGQKWFGIWKKYFLKIFGRFKIIKISRKYPFLDKAWSYVVHSQFSVVSRTPSVENYKLGDESCNIFTANNTVWGYAKIIKFAVSENNWILFNFKKKIIKKMFK